MTIDAIGCQKAIGEQIHKAGGGYVIAVRENQPNLHDSVRDVIREQLDEVHEDSSTGCVRPATKAAVELTNGRTVS